MILGIIEWFVGYMVVFTVLAPIFELVRMLVRGR